MAGHIRSKWRYKKGYLAADVLAEKKNMCSTLFNITERMIKTAPSGLTTTLMDKKCCVKIKTPTQDKEDIHILTKKKRRK